MSHTLSIVTGTFADNEYTADTLEQLESDAAEVLFTVGVTSLDEAVLALRRSGSIAYLTSEPVVETPIIEVSPLFEAVI